MINSIITEERALEIIGEFCRVMKMSKCLSST